MSQYIRGIGDSRVNILSRKSWICFKEITVCCPVAKLPENQLDWYSSSPYHRLAHHYFRIDLNSIGDCHSGLDVGSAC